MEKFFMIYVDGRNMPFKKYSSYQDAEKESIRLCEKEKCATFILETIVKFEMKNVVKTVLG